MVESPVQSPQPKEDDCGPLHTAVTTNLVDTVKDIRIEPCLFGWATIPLLSVVILGIGISTYFLVPSLCRESVLNQIIYT